MRRHEPLFAALVLVTGIGPLATDAYLPALPQVQRTLSTSASAAQLTMTAFIVGLAAGQLLFGPISDGVGRRSMMLASSTAFAATSVCCALAPNVWVLIAARLVQGMAGGCGVALGRAVVSDRYEGDAAATRYGTLMSVTLLGPVVAPAVGGVILAVGDWRVVFTVLTSLGVAMVALVWFGLPETLPPDRRHAHGLTHTAQRMKTMLRTRAFLAPVVVQCLATAGFFVYIGGSSIVLHDQFGIGSTEYAIVFATNAVAMVVVSITFRLTVVRFGAVRLRNIGLTISTAAAATLFCYAVIARHSTALAPTWALLACMVAGGGLSIPATTTLAQQAGRAASGTASALQGGLTFTVGALATPLTGFVGGETVLAMSALSLGLYLLALVLLALLGTSVRIGPAKAPANVPRADR